MFIHQIVFSNCEYMYGQYYSYFGSFDFEEYVQMVRARLRSLIPGCPADQKQDQQEPESQYSWSKIGEIDGEASDDQSGTSIAMNIDGDYPQILFTGGGAKNKFLMARLSKKMKRKFQLPEIEIIDFKEALIFAFLGILKVRNEINCLRSVTGAEKDHSSGVYFK